MPKGGQAGELGRRLLATAVAAAMLSSSCSFSVFCRHTLPLGRGSAALHTQRRGVLTTAPAASRRADYRVMMCAGEPAPDMKSGVEATIAKKTKKPAVRERPAHVEAGQRWNTTVSLESLRALQANFALERNWDQHHTPRNLALAMVGEVGELCECFQWRPDADTTVGLPSWSENDREHVGEEMSDVLLYLVRLADKCDVNLAEAVMKKIDKNAAKYPAHLVKGSSAKYTAYAGNGGKKAATRVGKRGRPTKK